MMSTASEPVLTTGDFRDGIQYFGEPWPGSDKLAVKPVIGTDARAITDPTDPACVFQTLLAADALRYLTLQICGSKASGHPGGYASSAEAHAALMMLGHKHIVTEAGHHAPGFYSAMFLDGSLHAMDINTVSDLCARFRERHGLLGHLSGAIPGLLAPAGPLGQGQHFAMGGALLNPGTLFPLTLGDGGLGEPYIMSAFMHFKTAFPRVTNFLPVLVWNGYSQEHHSMVSPMSNDAMIAYWEGHGFEDVILVDAKAFDDTNQDGAYVDSTRFLLSQRLAFQGAVLQEISRAGKQALGGKLTAFIIKQLKGAGVHTTGAKAHNLYPADTLDAEHIIGGLKRRALSIDAWELVRKNLSRAGGGPAGQTVATEQERALPSLGDLPLRDFLLGENQVPATAFGALVAAVGQRDPQFIVSNADGNEASAMKNINDALKIRHPTTDPRYNQSPNGQVYEPLSEDACAGLSAAIALLGGRSLWLSYESFAINGWPIVQTVSQAMAELRRKTPSQIVMFTAGALEQGRNGWTHQRPEIESYCAAMMRNGNHYPLFPSDANMVQVAYDWALGTHNKTIAIFASKTALPVRTTLAQARTAIEDGAVALYETAPGNGPLVVMAVAGDMILLPVFIAREALEKAGVRVRIVSMANPRRLYRPDDVSWNTVNGPDDKFMDDAPFAKLFGGDALLAISGGTSATLEPVLLRSPSGRSILCWKRGETVAAAGELMSFNGVDAPAITARARALLGL
ncbi:MAG: phosphoketolase family protein [Acidiferrobacteraceae bacterium]